MSSCLESLLTRDSFKKINLLRVVRSRLSLLTTEIYGLAQIHRLMEEEKERGKGEKKCRETR